MDEDLPIKMAANNTPLKNINNVKVKGIDKFDTYPICFKSKCQGKVAEDNDDEDMGKCLRCGTIQVF